MVAAAARYLRIRRKGLPSRFIALLAVFAFALQAYIAQTHIHGVSPDFGGIVKTTVPESSTPGKTPINDGAQDCPFCKAVAQSSFFIAPPTLISLLPSAPVETVAFVYIAQTASDAVAHDWLSRAPPRR